ncbi:TolC family protein [Candidatus Omnitrophota bacterium]
MIKIMRFTVSIVVFIVLVYSGGAYGGVSDAGLLDSLISQALKDNPRIEASLSRWKAQEYKITQARSLPDPSARYTYFGDNVETRVGPQEHKYGGSQKIPFPLKLSAKANAQKKKAQMAKEEYEATKREIIKDVKFIYCDIYWIDTAIRVTEEEKTIIERVEKVAQKKYESNLTPQQDVIKAQVELSKMLDKLFKLRQHRKSLVSKLNSVLSRSKDAKLDSLLSLEQKEFKYSLDELQAIASDSRPELLKARLDIEKSEYERSLAGLDYLPDVTLGFDYIDVGEGSTTSPNDGDDAWMGTVSISVPIWFDKLGAQVNEKKASLNASQKNYEDVENRVTYEVEDLYFKITTYKDIVSLYESALVPQAQQAFDVTRTGYETGKIDLLNWLDSERVLLQTKLAYYKALVDYNKSIAFLERIVGKDL